MMQGGSRYFRLKKQITVKIWEASKGRVGGESLIGVLGLRICSVRKFRLEIMALKECSGMEFGEQ